VWVTASQSPAVSPAWSPEAWPTGVHPLSLHDALPIFVGETAHEQADPADALGIEAVRGLVEHEHARVAEESLRDGEAVLHAERRSEEHTSELQSRENLVCRLLLEKKKKQPTGRDQTLD